MSRIVNLSDDVKRKIADYVEGTTNNNVFDYKTSSQITRWFNYLFSPNIQWSSKVSRWVHATMLMDEMDNKGNLEEFFSKLLSLESLRREHNDSPDYEIAKKRVEGISDINKILSIDNYQLRESGANLFIEEKDANLEFLGSGGFADIYKIKGEEKVIKKLKNEYKSNLEIVSRFKQEYSLITQKLSCIKGVIKGFDYNDKEISYTMEYCDIDLKHFIENTPLLDESKFYITLDILRIISEVHEKGVIHRDINPKNIFIKGTDIIVADFGLGKDFDNSRTLCTYDTSGLGTYIYTDPRLFNGFVNADYKSDIYSLGKLINFIFKGNTEDNNHIYATVSKKALAEVRVRYNSVKEMIADINEVRTNHLNKLYEMQCENKIVEKHYDSSMDNYLLSFESKNLVYKLADKNFAFVYEALLRTRLYDEEISRRFNNIMDEFDSGSLSLRYECYDPIAVFALNVLKDKNNNEELIKTCVRILYFVAIDINRYNIQDKFTEAYSSSLIDRNITKEIWHKLRY